MNYQLDSDKHFYVFSKRNSPAIRMPSGGIIEIETLDCFSNLVKTTGDYLLFDRKKLNPVTGPIYIQDANPGDVLVIDILDIELDNYGVVVAGKGMGVITEKLQERSCKKIPISEDKAFFNTKLQLPIKPMIGTIGVTPNEKDIITLIPGSFGGNLDNNMITAGASLYLPVFVDGALFGLGDLHAIMGDGEVGDSGLEIAGKVRIKVTVKKDINLSNPVLKDGLYFSTIASALSIDDAVNRATNDMFNILSSRLDILPNELMMLMSLSGEAQICQIVNPLKTARFLIPKYVLERYDFEF